MVGGIQVRMSKQPETTERAARRIANSKSMHADVTDDVDCCSCEAEDRWRAVGEERDARGAGKTDPDAGQRD